MGLFSFLKNTTSNWWSNIKNLFKSTSDFDEILDSLEEMLMLGDVGAETTDELLSNLKTFIKNEKECTADKIYQRLIELIDNIVSISQPKCDYPKNSLNVIEILGINGVGKTTSIAKIANIFKKEYNVLVGGADTFRAAAGSQLEILCNLVGVKLVCGNDKESPSTVAYRTLDFAKANDYNLIIFDTAGRLHNKLNLMRELEKMDKSVDKFITDEGVVEKWLVVDGTMGQNVFTQIEEFNKIANLTGFIVTKTDSISKFGFIIGVINKFKIPVKYVGTGEGINDIMIFDPKLFVKDLLGR